MILVAALQALFRNLTNVGFEWANVALSSLDWADFVIQKGTLWLAFLGASLAATTGVEDYQQVVKYLMAGADVVMTASALLRHGAGRMTDLRDGLYRWMLDREYGSIDDLRGCMSLDRVPDAAAYERANYIRILEEFRSADYA